MWRAKELDIYVDAVRNDWSCDGSCESNKVFGEESLFLVGLGLKAERNRVLGFLLKIIRLVF